MSYKTELIEKKDLVIQLEASKSSIRDLFNNLLNEKKSFKYQITVKILLKKYKPNKETEFSPVYFNSATKTINNRLMIGLIKDLVGLLNQLNRNTLILRLIGHW